MRRWPPAPQTSGDSDTVEETRSRPERVAGKGIDDVVAHYARLADEVDAKPIVVGHSFDGLIAQRLLGENRAAAAVGTRRPRSRTATRRAARCC